MTLTVCGFDQQLLLEYGMDMADVHILRWLIDFWSTDKMKVMPVEEDGKAVEYVWVNYKKIIQDLPILKISSEHVIARHMFSLTKKGILYKHSKTEHLANGKFITYACYRLNGKIIDKLQTKQTRKWDVNPAFDNLRNIDDLVVETLTQKVVPDSSQQAELFKEIEQPTSGLLSPVVAQSPVDLKVQRPQKSGGNTITSGLKSPAVTQSANNLQSEFEVFTQAVGTLDTMFNAINASMQQVHSAYLNIKKEINKNLDFSRQNSGNTDIGNAVEETNTTSGLKSPAVTENSPVDFSVQRPQKFSNKEEEDIEEASSSDSNIIQRNSGNDIASGLRSPAIAENSPMDLKVQRPQKPGGNTLTGGLNSPLVAQNDIGKMKEEFKKIDAALLFDANFYPNAAVFMRDNSLDYDYLSWVYTTVKARKDVRNVRDYYFRIFTKPEMPELYKTQKEKEKQDAEANEKKRIKNTITCPACSTQFDRDTQNCPECGLAQSDFADNAKVARQIKIIRLSPEQYRERKDEIDKAYRDFHSPAEYADRIKRLSAIDNKYGISGDS